MLVIVGFYPNNTITYWGNGGRFDVVLCAFTSECLGEGNETHLGSTVVGLSEIACILRKKKRQVIVGEAAHTIQTSSTGGVNDTAELLLAE